MVSTTSKHRGQDGLAPEFGVVEAEDHFLSALDHGALDVDEQAVGVGDSFQGDAAGAHDGDVGVQPGKGSTASGPTNTPSRG